MCSSTSGYMHHTSVSFVGLNGRQFEPQDLVFRTSGHRLIANLALSCYTVRREGEVLCLYYLPG